MTAHVNPFLAAASASPVMEARRWIVGRDFPDDRPLINLSQAAPADPPPEILREAMARAVLENPAAHLYGPVLGLPALRAEIAGRWSVDYGGRIDEADVAVTSGCNQAFCAAVATLAGAGDEVILPWPWYFNHAMWLDMAGVKAVPLACGADAMPDPEAAAALIGPRTRALTLVTPNNPTGAEYPAGLIERFADLCQARGIALIIDETYRDFRSGEGPAHGLFRRPDWRDWLVHLYSFSKTFRLTGHRVGAMICGSERLAQAEKFLDTVTICPAQIGQIAALEGLRSLSAWAAGERLKVLRRRAVLEATFAEGAPGFELRSCGAYFAWLEHGFDMDSPAVAKALVEEASLLMLPGTMFSPRGHGKGTLRLAFANADEAGLAETARRLAAFGRARLAGAGLAS